MRSFRIHLLLAVFCPFVPAAPARAQTVIVDGSHTNQLIEGFGVNLNYQGWTNNDLKPVIDALVDQANMTLFRVVFDNTDWEATNDNGDPDVMNWTYYNTVYSSPRFQQLWGVMGYLNQKGITNGAIFNFQGPGPAWMGGPTLTPGYEDEWAEMIVSLLYYARNTQKLQFSLIEPDNEPDCPYQGVDFDSYAQYVTMLHDLAVKLDTNGMSDIRFVAPDLAYTDTNLMAAIMTDPVVMAKLTHFGLHSYSAQGVGSTGIYNLIRQSAYPGVSLWMTEFNNWCSTCEAGLSGPIGWSFFEGTTQYLLGHLANGASAGMVWDAYDSIYYRVGATWSFWGLFAVNDTNAVDKTYTPRKNFYTFAQISKFVLPGAYSIGVTGNASPFAQLMAFWQPATGQFTLVGVNTDFGADPLTVNLASLPGIPSLQLYYTDPNSNLVQLATFPVNNGTNFTVRIPANCVFTLVGDSVISASITQPATGTQFSAPAAIPIQASVSTATGTISGVSFFSGTTNIGAVATPPYNMVWSNVPPGNYTLTVNASNSAGTSRVSPPVAVTVVGPLAQVSVVPSNVDLVPFASQQFSAFGADAAGNLLNPQPAFSWSATGGTIGSNGLFTAGSAGGSFAVTAGNNSVAGSANVTVLLNNLSALGVGYTWYSMSNSGQNSPIAPAPGINDGDLTTSVPLLPVGNGEPSQAWEAAGIIWSTPQTINQLTYINGAYNQSGNGVFAGSFGLQFSPDGTTWTNAGLEWTVAPAYSYNSAASAAVNFNFTGGRTTAQGVRCVGLVHTSSDPQNSWLASAAEVQAFAAPPQRGFQVAHTPNGIVISWDSFVINYVLETSLDLLPPRTWSVVTNTPQIVGSQQEVIVTPAATSQLFRLRPQ